MYGVSTCGVGTPSWRPYISGKHIAQFNYPITKIVTIVIPVFTSLAINYVQKISEQIPHPIHTLAGLEL